MTELKIDQFKVIICNVIFLFSFLPHFIYVFSPILTSKEGDGREQLPSPLNFFTLTIVFKEQENSCLHSIKKE